MPSNHVYYALVDRYGYLWLGTKNGLVRYNGYDIKTFNLSDGLPTNDIWDLFEDRQGRIWLSSIAYYEGYIYKNKFKRQISNNEDVLLFPRHLIGNEKGVFFLSDYTKKSSDAESSGIMLHLCRNDSLYSFILSKSVRLFFDIDYFGNIALLIKDSIYKLLVDKDSVRYIPICKMGENFYGGISIPFKARYISYSYDNTFFYVLNPFTCDYRKIEMKMICNRNEKIERIYTRKDSLFLNYVYIITKDSVYKTDTDFHVLEVFCIRSLANGLNNGGSNIVGPYEDSLWGTCMMTNYNGLYLNFKDEHFKKINSFDLSGYKNMGQVADNFYYWWNNEKQTLLEMKGNKPGRHFACKNINRINKIVKYVKDSAIILDGPTRPFLIDLKTGNILPYLPGLGKNSEIYRLSGANNAIVYDRENIYAVRKTGLGMCKFMIERDTLLSRQFENERYFDLVFDSLTNSILAYTQQRIFIYFIKNNREYIIPWKKLLVNGIRQIEQIVIDNKYGNIFIKDYEKLFVLNLKKDSIELQSYTELLKNYRLANSSIYIYKGKLIVAGIFGVLFCKITGPHEIGKPIVYQNVKGINYSSIDDIQVSDDTVLLKTDAGLYSVAIPDDEMLSNASGEDAGLPYKFLFAYNDTVSDALQTDTLFIEQKNMKLSFDIINPRGNGKVVYSYQFANKDSLWRDLSSNELDLSHLGKGRYYHLSVAAHDDVWQTDKRNLYVYIIPYWWQKPLMRNLLWLAGVLLIILIIVFIVFITKRIVSDSNTRRNLKLELELKSVYSQINPHFIFNALSSAMYFIKKKKMDEAYTHVLTFSRLLRAYIKSSRKRYITLAEEIVNLRNYIELQLARFEDRFEYEIKVDENIDTQQVNIPSLLLQPIVENAINHGLFHKEEKGHLEIEFKMNSAANEMVCIIDDNGIGRENARKINESSLVKTESYGDQLIKDLINIFNRYEQIKIEIAYIDKVAPLSGTTVTLKIKNILHEK